MIPPETIAGWKRWAEALRDERSDAILALLVEREGLLAEIERLKVKKSPHQLAKEFGESVTREEEQP